MEKNLKKDIYMYNWITLLYTWNIVNQLYFNKINKSESGIELYLIIVDVWYYMSQVYNGVLHKF